MLDNFAEMYQHHVTVSPDSDTCGNPAEIANKAPEYRDLPGTPNPRLLCQDVHYPCQGATGEKEHPSNAPGTRLIPLTKGQFAVVDEADYPRVAAHKWHAYQQHRDKTFYAVRSIPNPRRPGTRTKIFLHREILGIESPVDHRDRNGLNNSRANLRPATIGENNRNIDKPRHGVTSVYKGVSWHERAGKYQATVRYQRHNYYLGLFADPVEAAYAYDREARLRFGAFARCNFPPPPVLWRPR